ncbi:MAG: ABC transporter permease subunit [bacterium]|nr:ABC transporter permease subunit [bacterium]
MRRHKSDIYQSRVHLVVTLLIVVVPFILFIVFAQAIEIPVSKLFLYIGTSGLRLLIAYTAATIIALILATLFYKGKRGKVALPLFDVLQNIPTFTLLPIATLFWGASERTVVLLLTIIMLWPIFFSIINALQQTRSEWDEAVQIMKLSGWKRFRHYILPVGIPGLVTGSIIAIAEGWEAIIAAEIITNISGLGQFFQAYSTNPTVTAAGILGILVLIFGLNKLVWMPLLEKSHSNMES